MSIIQLDSLVPASLSGSLKTNKEILTEMYVDSNDGNNTSLQHRETIQTSWLLDFTNIRQR